MADVSSPFPDSRPLDLSGQPEWPILPEGWTAVSTWGWSAVTSDLVTWRVSHFPCRGRGHRWHRIRWFMRHPVRSWR